MAVSGQLWSMMGDYGDVNEEEESVHLPFSQVDRKFMPKVVYGYDYKAWGQDWLDNSCPHAQGGRRARVLVLINQNGHDGSGICLDCLMEWVERNHKRIWSA